MKRLGVPEDDPRYEEARRVLRAEKLVGYVKKTIAGSPKLTDEQLDRVAALLRPGS